SATDVWAVGGVGNGELVHFDGQLWTSITGGAIATFAPLLGVWASESGALDVVGRQGFLAARAAGTGDWRVVDPPPTIECLHNVAPYAGGLVAVGGNLLTPANGLHGVLLRQGAAVSTRLP